MSVRQCSPKSNVLGRDGGFKCYVPRAYEYDIDTHYSWCSRQGKRSFERADGSKTTKIHGGTVNCQGGGSVISNNFLSKKTAAVHGRSSRVVS